MDTGALGSRPESDMTEATEMHKVDQVTFRKALPMLEFFLVTITCEPGS